MSVIFDNYEKIKGHKALNFCRKYLSLPFNDEIHDLMQRDLKELGENNYCLGTCVKKNEIKYIAFKFMKEDEFTKACDYYCEFVTFSLMTICSRAQ